MIHKNALIVVTVSSVLCCTSLFAQVNATAPRTDSAVTQQADWDWQRPHARVKPKGDLEWRPEPFQYEPGESVRYIDFQQGSDAGDGSQQSPWQHHPWDPQATGQAAAASGVHTYVFKNGVDYRGTLLADESGTPDHPIRLTRDPNWGVGDAVLCGSQWIRNWQQGVDHPDIPAADKVWFVDLDFCPRNVWMMNGDEKITRIPLARTPNWVVSDPVDVKSQWWHFDNPKQVWDNRKTLNGADMNLAFDTKNLTRSKEYYEGALIWPEYGWVMGTPYPTKVQEFDPEKRGLVFGGQWSRSAGAYHVGRYCRYYLEDKPHYLDDATNGEFWFDKQGGSGRLYLRLPDDQNPNHSRVEVARWRNLIDSRGMNHVHVTGLTFRFTNVIWDLTAPPHRVTNRPQHADVNPACIRLIGSGRDLVVGNCCFEHVTMPIRFQTLNKSSIDRVVVRDNVIRFTDHGAIAILDDGDWGVEYPEGRLYDVRILRNQLSEIGHRPDRFGQGQAIEIQHAQTLHVAGNFLHRVYAGGIFVRGAKTSHARVDRPLVRILIHHNKVVEPLVMTNDFGGIETWQGGPAYVFNNISADPGGYRNWAIKIQPDRKGNARFGHAYYMDGAFKQYYFNNIAWGRSRDPLSPRGNTAAFQEIHGYLANVFNNTVYNFVKGSRRQAPEAGRNKYLGNIWHSIGHIVLRHADPSKTGADPNAADAGQQKSTFQHETNAYVNNLFYAVPEILAVFEPSGRWHTSLRSFQQALAARGTIGNAGQMVNESPLRDPANHDFRPTKPALDAGVRLFVPWGLYANVAEWHFYHAGDQPDWIVDEHWYMEPHYVNRVTYHKEPRYPLRTVNMNAQNYVRGPLEDWTNGALRLNGRNQYAVCTHQTLNPGPEHHTANVKESNFLIEAYFQIEPGHTDAVLIQKLDDAGYALTVNQAGQLMWEVRSNQATKSVTSREALNDGQWHHVIAELDRSAKRLTIFVDGQQSASAEGVGPVSLANQADLFVGGTPNGRCVAGTLEFVRISLGTLADAKTSIEELYAWQFAGPAGRDFHGHTPTGQGRDAGAIESH